MTLFGRLFAASPGTSEVLITDVTRMHGGNVCIAGLAGTRTIRLHKPQPTGRWLLSISGLAPGDLVRVAWQAARGVAPPHVEDADWRPSTFRKVRRLSDEEFAAIMQRSTVQSVAAAFGAPLFAARSGNVAFRPGTGRRSLATLRARSLHVYPHDDGIRADFSDKDCRWQMVPVEDLAAREHQRGCRECADHLDLLLTKEFGADDALVRIGLTREYKSEENPVGCYLQVNYILPLPPRPKHFTHLI